MATEGKNILLLSPLQPCSGNTATILRIRNGLEKNGMKCDVVDSIGISNGEEFTCNHGNQTYHLIIAVHAYKSGRLLLDTEIPCVIILGGTDVNQLYNEDDKMTVMSQAVLKSKHIVAFSTSVREQFIKCWPDYNRSNISIIPQGVCVNPSSSFNLVQYLYEHNMLKQSSDVHNGFLGNNITTNDKIDHTELKIFCIIGAIRSVKNPTYILREFSEWRARRRLYNCWLLLIGSNFNDAYYNMFSKTVERCKGVIYIPGLSSDCTHSVIRDSFCLINTSESEGMALAILEAMSLDTLVIARNIPGNRNIVEDNVTGILFDSPQELITKLEEVIENTDRVATLTWNAREYIRSNHSVDREEQGYVNIIRKYT